MKTTRTPSQLPRVHKNPHESSQRSSMCADSINKNACQRVFEVLCARQELSPGPTLLHRAPSSLEIAPGAAQDESEVFKTGSHRGRGLCKLPSREGSTAIEPPSYLRAPWGTHGPPRSLLRTLQRQQILRFVVVPAESLMLPVIDEGCISLQIWRSRAASVWSSIWSSIWSS